jgi:putative Holliday junction resolvase
VTVAATVGRVLALDPGQRRIGVAVSDRDRTMAFPRPAITVDPSGRHLDAISSLVEEEGAVAVVIGLPKGLDGREGASARSARTFAAAVSERLASDEVAVELHDERLTTVQAAGALRSAGQASREQRSSIDSAAATVLLEAWISCR